MALDGGARTKLTSMTGGSSGELSPDGRTLGVIYSAGNKPPEVYLMPSDRGRRRREGDDEPDRGVVVAHRGSSRSS